VDVPGGYMGQPRQSSASNKDKALYRPTDFIREADVGGKKEGVEPYRSNFRRDYQRLLHAPSFRRLQGKTQLFPSEENDFYRTRLTHSLEVAQISKSIAIRLNNTNSYFKKHNIDLDLIEFAALAHDLGHPPFGHNGEYILDELMINHGGFEGNGQTFRILSRLEKKATSEFPPTRPFDDHHDLRRGLNLTYRSLAAVLKYDRMIPRTMDERVRESCRNEPCKGYYAVDRRLVEDVKEKVGINNKGRFKTIECSIMDVADDIAYSTYDIEDAFAAGFLNPISILASDDSVKQEIARRIERKLGQEFPELSQDERLFSIDDMNESLASVFSSILELDPKTFEKDWSIEGLGTFVGGEVYRASTYLAKSPYHRAQFTSDLIGFLINRIEVAMSSDNPVFWQVRPTRDSFCLIETLKMICYIQLIRSDKFLAERRRAKFILESIFTALVESGSDLLPSVGGSSTIFIEMTSFRSGASFAISCPA
jgi:dGTPase